MPKAVSVGEKPVTLTAQQAKHAIGSNLELRTKAA
jgi:hypothetical protein